MSITPTVRHRVSLANHPLTPGPFIESLPGRRSGWRLACSGCCSGWCCMTEAVRIPLTSALA